MKTSLEFQLVRSANRLMLTDKWILADKCWLFVWKYRTIDNVAEITLYQKLYQKFEIANGQSGCHSNKMNVSCFNTYFTEILNFNETVFGLILPNLRLHNTKLQIVKLKCWLSWQRNFTTIRARSLSGCSRIPLLPIQVYSSKTS